MQDIFIYIIIIMIIICTTIYNIVYILKIQCKHEWVLTERITIHDECNNVVGHKVVLQCKKCGEIKTQRLE